MISPLLLLLPLAPQQLLRADMTDAAAPVHGVLELSAGSAAVKPSLPTASGTTIGQLAGFPKLVGGNSTFAPTRGIVLADLDGDGRQEVILSSTDGQLYVWEHDGGLVPGFPVACGPYAQSAPAVGDLDGDGSLEIVQFARGVTSGGRVFAWDAGGTPLAGFPVSFTNHNLEGSPCLIDLDDDGELEILVPERDYPIGHLHVLERDGSEWGGNWPVTLDHVPTCTPAVGDVDADGELEIAYLSYTSIYLLELDGTSLAGWPQGIPNANFSYQSPALADLDADGDLEIVVGAHQSAAGVYAFQHDGSLLAGWPQLVGTWTYCPPTVADLDGDGRFEILSGREGFGPGQPSALFWAWYASGAALPGFPYVESHGGGSAGPITIADLEGDGRREIFASHNITENGEGFLYGVDAAGNDLPGFPLRPIGFTYQNGATLGDVDGDGDLELAVCSFEGSNVRANVYDLDAAYEPARIPWETYHVRARRGGLEGSADDCRVTGNVTPGGTLRLRVVGEPGELGSLWLAHVTEATPTPFGWLYLKLPFRRTFLADVPVPAAGQLAIDLVVPNQLALIGVPLYWQGRLLDGQGGGRMTNLVGTVVQ